MVVIIHPPAETLKLLHDSVALDKSSDKQAAASLEEEFAYVAALAAALAESHDFDRSSWTEQLQPYMNMIIGGSDVDKVVDITEKFRLACERVVLGDLDHEDSDDEEGGENVCDIRFNLAYGGKILLHQTRLRLRCGHRYGLVGQNGVGKTTLMNAINTGKLDDWPKDVTTEYVDSGSNVDPEYEAQIVLPYLIKSSGKADESKEILKQLKFTEAMMEGAIGSLSGGWQMKLRLCKAVLKNADILLLDEPTNHLDHATVRWLTEYLLGLKDTTVLTVSHDTAFMEEICSDIIHYEKRDGWIHRKLVNYRGTMSQFVKKQPQAKHYFELATADLKFVFPEPGRLEGIRTATQTILEMGGVDYRYPGVDVNQLTDINLKMTLSSRIAVLGANGAGKTTLVKMMVGDSLPSNLGKCKLFIHHNLRVAYVAQHSFHHVEQHMDIAPAAYIQWRFKDAYDKEKLESTGFKISDEEQEKIDAFGLEGIWSRRLRAGILEYEVKKRNVPEKDNKYFSKVELLEMGFEKLLRQTDEKIAAKEAGLDLRPVTTTEIQKHLDDFGLPQEFGTYGKIRGLSGGQKVKLVLAAAMWNQPHLLILDEPTNYLDREALGALSTALNEWGGAVLMISHNKEFYTSVCKEEWHVRDGRVFIEGISSERKMKAVARKKKVDKELDTDEQLESAGGNMNSNADKHKNATVDFWGKSMAKKDVRNFEKAKKKGDIAVMRKLLQIPKGKVMPGYESLGNGS